MSDALSEAVAKAEAQLEREVWIAVRVSSTGNVAFMGAFDTLEHAQERCEYGKYPVPYIWHPRSPNPDVQEYETGWMALTENTDIRFVIALRHVQDHGEPTKIGTGEKL